MRNPRTIHCFDIKHSLFYTNLHSHTTTIHSAARISQKAAYSSTSKTTHRQSRLHGRTAMITGGSSGIGYAIAERFLQEGASKVILVGRKLEKLQDASKRLSQSIPYQPNYDRNGEIDTRAPEDDRESEADPRVGFVVGDVSVASEWMGELEKEMVFLFCMTNIYFCVYTKSTTRRM
jgi:short chain dehydrogenase